MKEKKAKSKCHKRQFQTKETPTGGFPKFNQNKDNMTGLDTYDQRSTNS
jgi:hypothetical protein